MTVDESRAAIQRDDLVPGERVTSSGSNRLTADLAPQSISGEKEFDSGSHPQQANDRNRDEGDMNIQEKPGVLPGIDWRSADPISRLVELVAGSFLRVCLH